MMRLFVLLAALATLHAADAIRPRPTTWAQPVLGVKTGNFFKVSDDVYRSEQPDDDQLGELKALGIKSVLSLRQYHDDDELKTEGIKLYRISMNAGDIVDAEIQAAMKILRECEKPVLVHCWHGSDRTGVVIAAYRVLGQGWSREDAIDEFENGGFGYHKNWYPNIETYLRHMAVPGK
jgi:protein tyrosine phosphatase (PTP) superfamily phosphohydrolase (DUF442 family)